ncbi:uncharacterized protein VP01_8558g1, partial [Puccinia sorghi]
PNKIPEDTFLCLLCWFQVGCEFSKEMGDNLSIYSRLLGGEKAVKTIISQLNKMDHRKAIANTFQRPVVYLSVKESLSFIPTTTSVNGNHWVLALLKATDRSKPIPPVIGLTKLASQVTCSWRSELNDYFTLYNQDLQSIKKI